jgi:hypothetical protein
VLSRQHGVALKGYDAVAYTGKPPISHQWQDVTWLFATREHRQPFKADPPRYAPQFGGCCAFAVAQDTSADGDPHQWVIVDGNMYVNTLSASTTRGQSSRPH